MGCRRLKFEFDCNFHLGNLSYLESFGMRTAGIVKDKNRNWKQGFRDTIMATYCALHNFRLKFRPWHYPPIQLHLFVEIYISLWSNV